MQGECVVTSRIGIRVLSVGGRNDKQNVVCRYRRLTDLGQPAPKDYTANDGPSSDSYDKLTRS